MDGWRERERGGCEMVSGKCLLDLIPAKALASARAIRVSAGAI
jgi:hypothetical protein